MSAQIRTVAADNGFDILPSVSPLPDINPWQPTAIEMRKALDAEVLDRINTVLRAYGRPAMNRMADLSTDANPILATVKELDNYGERADAFYAGLFYGFDEGAPAEWPDGNEPRIFVHLRPHMKCFSQMIEVTRDLAMPTLCVVPRLTHAESQNRRTRTLAINGKPVALKSALARADLAIGYGGIGTTTEEVLAGVQQIILPEVLALALCGQRLETIGAGICLAGTREVNRTKTANTIECVLSESKFWRAAGRFADQNKRYNAGKAREYVGDQTSGALTNSMQNCVWPRASTC
ncbi:nucleotide disphospho-sugar-binding domain-containing protein [Nitrogeniibacter aestuarii]|uniref:nucleotide disphospho-sugar-binding domain-containing protein n=1 Tax=Nitrogeniibacter aestuarii TaxID=2815343 RepID=UPI001D0F9D0E|nr:nucleotide disphospho-sugar-binding domain-containing protein [Nitrogeniibacter aestuarii]